MNSNFDIRINNDGQVVITQTTTMTPEEYLSWAQQVYQFQITMRGAPVTEGRRQIAEDRK